MEVIFLVQLLVSFLSNTVRLWKRNWPMFLKLGEGGEISGSAGYMLPEEVKEQHIPVAHYHHCYTLQLKGPTASVELLSSNRIRLRLDQASTRWMWGWRVTSLYQPHLSSSALLPQTCISHSSSLTDGLWPIQRTNRCLISLQSLLSLHLSSLFFTYCTWFSFSKMSLTWQESLC